MRERAASPSPMEATSESPAAPQSDRPARWKTYAAAFSGWLLGGLGPPVVVTIGLIAAVEATCGTGSSDCSWGFEIILAIPVLLAAFLGTGPALVRRFVGGWVDASLGPPAARTTRWGAVTSIVALYPAGGSGSEAFFGMLVLIAVGVPAAVVWRLENAEAARRKVQDAG